jgi:hypothetical protein
VAVRIIRKNIYLVVFVIVSCGQYSVKTANLNDGSLLNESSLLEAKKSAEKGSNEAALKLISHYRYGQFNLEGLLYWLEVSARMGDANSARGLGGILIGGDYSFKVTRISCEKGQTYLKACSAYDELCSEDYLASKEICKNLN